MTKNCIAEAEFFCSHFQVYHILPPGTCVIGAVTHSFLCVDCSYWPDVLMRLGMWPVHINLQSSLPTRFKRLIGMQVYNFGLWWLPATRFDTEFIRRWQEYEVQLSWCCLVVVIFDKKLRSRSSKWNHFTNWHCKSLVSDWRFSNFVCRKFI